MSNVVIRRRQDAEREMNGAESRKIGQEAGGRMKTENGPRYQETEIVSYVQVINKAEIDRYLQRGREKKCDGTHGMEGAAAAAGGELGSFFPKDQNKRKKATRERETWLKKRKGGKRRERGRAERERVNNDTSGEDLDEHVVLGLTWPAEMMRILTPPLSPPLGGLRSHQLSPGWHRLQMPPPRLGLAMPPSLSRLTRGSREA